MTNRWVAGTCALALWLLAWALPAAANVIGVEQYLGFKALSYSGDFTIERDGETIKGRVFRAPDRMRSEFAVDQVPLIAIADLESGQGRVYSVPLRAVAKVTLTDPGVRDWVPQLRFHRDVVLQATGSESDLVEVNGQMTRHYTLSGRSPEGTGYSADLWATAEGAIMRVVADIATEPGPVTYNLYNLRLGEQPAALFAFADAGFTPVTWAQVLRALD